VDRRRPEPGGADARSWWLTAIFAAVVAILAASYGSLWSTICAALLAVATLLAVARAYRARVRPAAAPVVVTVAGLVVAAAVLSIAAVLTGWR
jgi:uncharacterized protein (DUF697 family)